MKIRVGVVFGGESVEHEVSVISALQGIEALDKERYEVIPLYISKQRDFYSSPALLEVENYKNLDELIQKATPVVLVKKGKEVVVEPIKKVCLPNRSVRSTSSFRSCTAPMAKMERFRDIWKC